MYDFANKRIIYLSNTGSSVIDILFMSIYQSIVTLLFLRKLTTKFLSFFSFFQDTKRAGKASSEADEVNPNATENRNEKMDGIENTCGEVTQKASQEQESMMDGMNCGDIMTREEVKTEEEISQSVSENKW